MPEKPEMSAKRAKINTPSAVEITEYPPVIDPWPFEDTPWRSEDEKAKISTKSAVEIAAEYPPVTEKWPWPPLEEKEAKIPMTSVAKIIVEYPPVTEHKRGFIAPYLTKCALEDKDEEVDDRGDKHHTALQIKKVFLKQVRESREGQREGTAISELQKRLEVSVLLSNPEHVIDEMEDKELIQLALRVGAEEALSNMLCKHFESTG